MLTGVIVEVPMKKFLLFLVVVAVGVFVWYKRKKAAEAEQALWDEATGA